MNAHDTVMSYGMVRIGSVRIVDDSRFAIDLDRPEARTWKRCIYAFVVNGEIVRIGKSNALGNRLRQWQNDVSAALRGEVKPGGTPFSEAEQWRHSLTGSIGDLYSREGTVVTTPVGAFNAYEWEERELIRRHRPRMCHDWGKSGHL